MSGFVRRAITSPSHEGDGFGNARRQGGVDHGGGIGEAAALALSGAGAGVALTGRREAPLHDLARRIEASGQPALVAPGDMTAAAIVGQVAEAVVRRFGRLDILVNNAGLNIRNRRWDQLTPEAIDSVLHGNLSAAFYCAAVALKAMRANGGGVLIHTASWAGKFIGPLSGPAYTAAKHAVVAMSHSINMEEYGNGIRSTAILPAEVATAILDERPVPPPPEVRATMLRPDDLGELILFIATRPASVCLNEVVISPTANRMYG